MIIAWPILHRLVQQALAFSKIWPSGLSLKAKPFMCTKITYRKLNKISYVGQSILIRFSQHDNICNAT